METDPSYMVPANLCDSLPPLKGVKVLLSHSAMVPWIADFVANVAGPGWNAKENAYMV